MRQYLVCLIFAAALAAQSPPPMSMPAAPEGGTTAATAFLEHAGSGTAAQPASVAAPMPMFQRHGWMLMLHGTGFLTLQQQAGARGFDKLFSTNWAMGMAQRDWGPGRLTLRSMLSLEPATVTDRQFPELFQTGETAFGRPIVDGQHPHNFFMELGALYDLKLGECGLLTLYAAPMGDPAIGPEAYPHRASAADDPLAPLGHHLEDSTHIAADVVTVGAAYGIARLEGSAFHGREPNENRWAVQTGALDSYSTRLTLSPAPDWTGQYSLAHIRSPEALEPATDQIRMTASLSYHTELPLGDWANTLLWGRTRNVGGGNVLTGYLLESNLGFGGNHIWTRLENVDKSNELLLGGNRQPAGFEERFLGRIQAYSLGYDRELPSPAGLSAALGVQWTLYRAPASLRTLYGAHPVGVAIFLRVRLGE
ncbi:MAG: hypothetical protein ACRD1L_00360 [Terriglobales bacterium]